VVKTISPLLLAAALLPAIAPDLQTNHASGLRTLEVGTGRSLLVLLHGYGSTPQEWVPFSRTIQVSENERFVFPEAPDYTTPPDGPVGGRAWWRLDLAAYRQRGALPDLSASRPLGLDRSSDAVKRLLKDLQGRPGSTPKATILGGFSQGAMIAADVAFRSDEPLRALVILSGTLVDEATWTAGMPRRKGLPVFIAHGRRDDILPFAVAERFEQRMRRAGLDVTWVPFEGGHEMPAAVVAELNWFLAGLGAGPQR
jgi:phospholipase/carboxylesterase